MKKNIKNEVEDLKKFGEKTLGVFGARATGKTIYFTTLYGLSGFNNDDQTLSVICNDKDSRSYLKKNYKKLLNGKLPSRTEVNEINEINMSFFHNKNSYHLRSFDFAGELIKDVSDEESSPEFLKLQKKIYEFFGDCSALLIFLEPSDSKQETFERQAEIERLFDFLKKTKKHWDFDIPISLVVSKWDKISNVTEGYDYDKEEKKAIEYIKDHKIYNNIHSLVSGLTSQSKIFPVSAFGKAKKGDLPPDNIMPFNLFSPLIWASECRNQAWSKKVMSLLDENISSSDGKKIVNEFIDNISNEELLEPVIKKYKEFKRKKMKKKSLVAVLCLTIIGSGVGYFWYRNNQKEVYYKNIITEVNNKKQLEKLNSFLTMYNRNGKLGKELLKKRKKIFFEIIEDAPTLDGKLEKVNEFIKEEDLTKEEKSELISFQTEVKNKLKNEKRYNDLIAKVSKAKTDIEKYNILNEYIKNNDNLTHETKLWEMMNRYLKLADRNSYERIIDMKDKGNNDKLYEEIEKYLADSKFKEYEKEVKELKAEMHDIFLYTNVKKSLSSYNEKLTKEALNKVLQESDTYLSNNILGRSKQEVKSIIQKAKNIKEGFKKDLEIFIKGDNYGIQDKTIYAIMTIDDTEYEIKKITNNTNKVYLTTINTKMNFDTNINIEIYVTDKRTGDETSFSYNNYKIQDFNKDNMIANNSKDRIELEMRTDLEPYKLY